MSNSFKPGDRVRPKNVPVKAIGGVPLNQVIDEMQDFTVSSCDWNAGLKLVLKEVLGVYDPDNFEKVS